MNIALVEDICQRLAKKRVGEIGTCKCMKARQDMTNFSTYISSYSLDIMESYT